MRLKLKNKVTMTRLEILAILIFVEAFFGPLHNILGTGVWPTPVQLADILATAILQVATMFMALIEKAPAEEPKPS